MRRASRQNPTPLSLRAYGWGMQFLTPAIALILKRRQRKGKEHPSRLSERWGKTQYTRPLGPVVWMHGASVGEAMMLRPLIAHLHTHRPDLTLLVTTGTVTSAKLMKKHLPANAIHQFLPVDTPFAVKRFLKHWNIDLAIWTESELWPNLMRATHKGKIPMVMLNARMSSKSVQGWKKRAPKLAKALLTRFDLILPADQNTAQGLSELTGQTVPVFGNLKDAAPPLDVNLTQFDIYKSALGNRKLWVGASTHEGEEEILFNSLKALKSAWPDSLLILAPRHPERSEDIAKRAKTLGFKSVNLSSRNPPKAKTDILLIDQLDYLGLAFRLAPITVMGGSFLPTLSGHNPLEPARLNSAVISGPYVESFKDIYKELEGHDAVQWLSDKGKLITTLETLFSSPQTLGAQIKAAAAFTQDRQSILERTIDKLSPFLPERPPHTLDAPDQTHLDHQAKADIQSDYEDSPDDGPLVNTNELGADIS